MKNKIKTRDFLNGVYQPLNQKANNISALFEKKYQISQGFFNGHYHKASNQEYVKDDYPIPVISLSGLCDIELDFDSVCITAKLKKDEALKLDFHLLGQYRFEAYGVTDYLTDYGNEKCIPQMQEQMKQSAETEFFFSFSLAENIKTEELLTLINLLQKNDFYY